MERGTISVSTRYDPFEDIYPPLNEKEHMRIILGGIFINRILEGESIITKIDDSGVQGEFKYIDEHFEFTLLSKITGLWLILWIALFCERFLS
jgi:hypothetical protein